MLRQFGDRERNRRMPLAHLRFGRGLESDCSLCQFKFETKIPDAKDFRTFTEFDGAVGKAKKRRFEEWDEHLSNAHPVHWEQEQKKRARRRARTERFLQRQNEAKGQ